MMDTSNDAPAHGRRVRHDIDHIDARACAPTVQRDRKGFGMYKRRRGRPRHTVSRSGNLDRSS
jgi:hypothetical protein